MKVMLGATLQNYFIESILGEGGMGRVYKATDTVLGRTVAIKGLNAALTDQPSFLERFQNEAKTLARLNHPNIAVLYNYLQNGNDYYMVMEYVEGINLDELTRKCTTVPYEAVVPMIIQALEGLSHAHHKNVLHRDIKPANLMLTPHGTVKLMDFGIAKVSDHMKLTRMSRVIGTLEFLAPELVEGKEPSVVSDIYAMGVVMYELLTGHLPFEGRSDYVLMQEIVKTPPLMPRHWNHHIPQKLSTIVLKALEKEPERRFESATAFLTALAEAFPNQKQIPASVWPQAGSVAAAKITGQAAGSPSRPATGLPVAPATLLHQPLPGASVSELHAPPQQHLLSWRRNRLWYLGAAVLLLAGFTFFKLLAPAPASVSDDVEAKILPEVSLTEEPEALGSPVEGLGNNSDSMLLILNKKKQEEPQLAISQQNPARPAVDAKKPVLVKVPGGSSVASKPGQNKPVPAAVTQKDPEPEANHPGDVVDAGPIKLRGHGMPVTIMLQESLSRATAFEGQPISFKVTEPAMLKNEVILPRGAVLYATIKGLGARRMSIVFNKVSARGRSMRMDRSEMGAGMETVFSGKSFKASLRGTLIP